MDFELHTNPDARTALTVKGVLDGAEGWAMKAVDYDTAFIEAIIVWARAKFPREDALHPLAGTILDLVETWVLRDSDGDAAILKAIAVWERAGFPRTEEAPCL